MSILIRHRLADQCRIGLIGPTQNQTLTALVFQGNYIGTAGSYSDSGGNIMTHSHSPGWFTSTGQLKAIRTGVYAAASTYTSFQNLGFRDLSISRGL